MKYEPGQLVSINIRAMIDGNATFDFVKLDIDRLESGETFTYLYNEYDELCCVNGEVCTVDHIVNGASDVYDLVNYNDGAVHFMLTEHDLNLATGGETIGKRSEKVYEVSEQEDNSGFVICYTDLDGQDVWETVYGRDAMDIRIDELISVLGCESEDIMVFNRKDELI